MHCKQRNEKEKDNNIDFVSNMATKVYMILQNIFADLKIFIFILILCCKGKRCMTYITRLINANESTFDENTDYELNK